MNWWYILCHPRWAQKHIDCQEKQIESLNRALYGDRDWQIMQTEGNAIEVTCPCMTRAIETKRLTGYPFSKVDFTCPRCQKKLHIPELTKHGYEGEFDNLAKMYTTAGHTLQVDSFGVPFLVKEFQK